MLLTEKQFNRSLKKMKYTWRWDYHKTVINVMQELDYEKVLEIGCRELKVYKNSDVMDKIKNPQNTLTHDLDDIPYSIKNKEYDVVICLRALHYVKTDLRRVFLELRRVSKNIILAVPDGKKRVNRAVYQRINWEDLTDIKPTKQLKEKYTLIYYWNESDVC